MFTEHVDGLAVTTFELEKLLNNDQHSTETEVILNDVTRGETTTNNAIYETDLDGTDAGIFHHFPRLF